MHTLSCFFFRTKNIYITTLVISYQVLSVQKSLEMENATVFDRFEKWLIDNGAKFPGLYFKMYGPDQRGVHCKKDIDRNRRIMYVPLKCLITDQMARQTKTGSLLISIEKRLSAPNHNQIIVFMLEDMMKKDSFFKPYYDILPKDVSNFPVFWTDKEVEYLKGSTLGGEIQQRREKIRNDYNIIGGLIPGFFDNFTFEKFLWCRTIVGSRNFTITIDGSKRTSMVRSCSVCSECNCSSAVFSKSNHFTYSNTLPTFKHRYHRLTC